MLLRALRWSLATVALCLITLSSAFSGEMKVGETLSLVERIRPDGTDPGIPAHSEPGNPTVTARLASGSRAVIQELGGELHRNWVRVSIGGRAHWITTKYVASVEPVGAAPAACVVSCWNLEHFCKGAERGFPENQAGRYDPPGPTLPPRTEGQLAAIASTIVDRIKASFLVLCEVNGKLGKDEDGDPLPVSEELDELVAKLPPGWRYVVSHSGGEQRIAFLYDSSRCRVNEVIEFEVPHRRIQGSDVFARDPLAAHVTLLQNGAARNDLVIIGLHLASGQEKCKNHDAAMETVLLLLGRAQAEGKLGGNAEHDVLLLGDLNCNMFSPPAERFFLDMDDPAGDWDVLAGDDYPATRLSGSPLGLGSSQIDYIIASRKTAARDGLLGDEITRAEARVHTELLQWKPPDEFRRDLSDHLPVTVEVGVTDDKD